MMGQDVVHTLKGAVHHGPFPTASTIKIPATANIATRLQASMHPVKLLRGPTTGMRTTNQDPLTDGSMHNKLLLDRPTAQACINAGNDMCSTNAWLTHCRALPPPAMGG